MTQLPAKIILAGFMGTGKSSVAQVLAKKMGYLHVDTDTLVEQKAGKSIEAIFAQEGEEVFRRLEAQAIQEALRGPHEVISVGGGAVCFPENLKKLEKAGKIWLLQASVANIVKRVSAQPGRPLLQGRDLEEKIRHLLEQRATHYQKIKRKICTDDKSPEEVAEEIFHRMMHESHNLEVKLGKNSYPIYFSKSLQGLASLLVEHYKASKFVLLSNETVFPLHGKKLLKELSSQVKVEKIIIPDGEKFKNLKTLATIYSELVAKKVDRKTPLIALGGGVVGDVGGFAAATYLRGIPFVQVPTTLLAQVDSSIGGKTGVDLPEGKNLVGAFYQPDLVWVAESCLYTLSPRQLLCGMAEVIKYAAIFDAKLFSQLESEVESLLQNRGKDLDAIVRRCCELKAMVVAKDEKDLSGLRAKLNFGHTLGHAIESLTHYRRYTHGEAIAMGMVFASELSVKKSGLSSQAALRLRHLLEKAGLPIQWPDFSRKDYHRALIQDKKRVSSELHFVYLNKIGKSEVIPTPMEEILRNL